MNEICPVYKGMLDPIITSYKLTTCQLLMSHFRGYLLYRFYRIYCFKLHLSDRFYRGLIKRSLLIVQNDKDHLLVSAGAC